MHCFKVFEQVEHCQASAHASQNPCKRLQFPARSRQHGGGGGGATSYDPDVDGLLVVSSRLISSDNPDVDSVVVGGGGATSDDPDIDVIVVASSTLIFAHSRQHGGGGGGGETSNDPDVDGVVVACSKPISDAKEINTS